MNPSEIKKVLSELGGGANKRLGQHFLIDQAALGAIVEQAPVHPGAIEVRRTQKLSSIPLGHCNF